VQQIPYHCKLHAITDPFGLKAWAELDVIIWYVSLRVRFNLNALFTREALCYFRYFILLLSSSLNKNTKLLKKGQKKNSWRGGLQMVADCPLRQLNRYSCSEISFAFRLTSFDIV